MNDHHQQSAEKTKFQEHNQPTLWWAGEKRMVKIRQNQHLDRSEENHQTTDISYYKSFCIQEVVNNIIK